MVNPTVKCFQSCHAGAAARAASAFIGVAIVDMASLKYGMKGRCLHGTAQRFRRVIVTLREALLSMLRRHAEERGLPHLDLPPLSATQHQKPPAVLQLLPIERYPQN